MDRPTFAVPYEPCADRSIRDDWRVDRGHDLITAQRRMVAQAATAAWSHCGVALPVRDSVKADGDESPPEAGAWSRQAESASKEPNRSARTTRPVRHGGR